MEIKEKETKVEKEDKKEDKKETKETKKLDDLKNNEENKAAMEKIENKSEVKAEVKEDKREDKKVPVKESKKKSEEKKPELVREYVVPMRRAFLKAPEYRKSKKAVKYLKQFLAKHMKVEDRDVNKVKVDIYLNNEIWYRGIRNPLPRVKVIAEKIDGIVYARLADVPEVVKFKMAKDAKRFKKVDQKAMKAVKKKEESEEEIKEARSDNQDKAEEKEMEKAGAGAKEFAQKAEANVQKNKTSAKPNKADVSVLGKKSLKK